MDEEKNIIQNADSSGERVEFKKEGKIIVVTFFWQAKDKEDDLLTVKEVRKKTAAFLSAYPDGKFDVLADLTPLGNKVKYTTSLRSRKIFHDLLMNGRLGRVALVTNDMILKMVASFLIKSMGKKRYFFKIFSKKEDALQWLKGFEELS